MRPLLKLIIVVAVLASSVFTASFGKSPTREGIPPLTASQVIAALPHAKTQPMILMFKSRFCVDCKALLPVLQHAIAQPENKGIRLQTVDILTDRPKLPAIFSTFRPTTVPTVVLIARGGQIRESFVGMRSATQIRQSLALLHDKKAHHKGASQRQVHRESVPYAHP